MLKNITASKVRERDIICYLTKICFLGFFSLSFTCVETIVERICWVLGGGGMRVGLTPSPQLN
jgi:hypothetical protein